MDALLALVRQRRAELEAEREAAREAEVADTTAEMRARALAAFLAAMETKAAEGELDTNDMTRLNGLAEFLAELAERQPGPAVTAMTDIVVGIVCGTKTELSAPPDGLGDARISNAAQR